MYGTITVINPDAFIKAFSADNCDKDFIRQISNKDFFIHQEETKPLEDYKAPENFPNCCEYHTSILKIGLEHFALFPDCCENHKKLKTANWFKKNNFSYFPMKLVTTVAYTWHCICKHIESPDWYKKITDYIDYTTDSFGQLPEGYGPPVGVELYLCNIEKRVENENEIPEFKRKMLIDFIGKYYTPVKKVEEIDLNLLKDTYKNWLKDFPFDLSLFSHLKPHFENQMPILEGKHETNIYTGITGFKIITQKGFVDFLVSVTETIITEVNSLSLFEKGLIEDVQKANIDVINASRRFRLKETKEKPTSDRQQYIKVLKQWFKDEKEYLNELTAALIKVIPKQIAAIPDQQFPGISDFKNNFDNVSINVVFSHFKKGLVEKQYLTEKELIEYIKFAFDKREIPSVLFKLNNVNARQKVIKVFYDYYKNKAGKPHRQQKKYAELLSNYFEGYKIENVCTNFNK